MQNDLFEAHVLNKDVLPRTVDVSVVCVSYNTAELLSNTLNCLNASATGLSIRKIVVDNASRDGSAEIIRERFPDCHLIENTSNVGFARACNQALLFAEGPYILLLNTDALVSPDALEKTVAYMDSHPRCGVLGVKLVDGDGVSLASARYFPTPWNLFLMRTGLNRTALGRARGIDDLAWDYGSVRTCDWVPGCYFLVRRELIQQVGLFDPRYFLYYEEVDHCLAAKKVGWNVVCYPFTTVVHLRGASAKTEGAITQAGRQLEAMHTESELLYFRKNHGPTYLLLHLALSSIADVVLFLKERFRRKRPNDSVLYAKHLMLIWSSFRRTDYGRRPTR